MTTTDALTTEEILASEVEYIGDSRTDLCGLIGKPMRTRKGSVGVQYPASSERLWKKHSGLDGLVWSAEWSWRVVEPARGVQPIASDGIMERIDAELATLKARIAELEETKRVLKTL